MPKPRDETNSPKRTKYNLRRRKKKSLEKKCHKDSDDDVIVVVIMTLKKIKWR